MLPEPFLYGCINRILTSGCYSVVGQKQTERGERFLLSAMYLMGALIDIEQYEVTLGATEEIEGYGEITQEEYQKYITEISGLSEGEYGDYFSYEDIHEQMILKRNVYEFLYDVLPYGQARQYVSKDVKHPGRLWVYSLWWILVTTSFGVLVFRKKNIC